MQDACQLVHGMLEPIAPHRLLGSAARGFLYWVDRNGKPHAYTPLLANTLPVTLGYATPAQADSAAGGELDDCSVGGLQQTKTRRGFGPRRVFVRVAG